MNTDKINVDIESLKILAYQVPPCILFLTDVGLSFHAALADLGKSV